MDNLFLKLLYLELLLLLLQLLLDPSILSHTHPASVQRENIEMLTLQSSSSSRSGKNSWSSIQSEIILPLHVDFLSVLLLLLLLSLSVLKDSPVIEEEKGAARIRV